MNKNTALGKGLDALFSPGTNLAGIGVGHEEVIQANIDDVIANPDQPRKNFDQGALDELAVSIKEFGVLQPLVVTKNEQNKYSIIAGERRYRASRIAGLSKIPVIVRTTNELETLELALIENIQREDLSPLEQAASIQLLHDQYSQSYEQISKKLGKAYSTVANLVRLLGLPDEMKQALIEGKITEGHARALLSLQADPQNQVTLYNLITTKHLSVRQAEQYVVGAKGGKKDKQESIKRTENENSETKSLSKHLGVKVQLNYMAKGGKLTLRFKSDDELRDLIDRLSKA